MCAIRTSCNPVVALGLAAQDMPSAAHQGVGHIADSAHLGVLAGLQVAEANLLVWCDGHGRDVDDNMLASLNGLPVVRQPLLQSLKLAFPFGLGLASNTAVVAGQHHPLADIEQWYS